jgi:hypothetical protein
MQIFALGVLQSNYAQIMFQVQKKTWNMLDLSTDV